MTTITVRIPDHLLKEMERQAGELKVPRSSLYSKGPGTHEQRSGP